MECLLAFFCNDSNFIEYGTIYTLVSTCDFICTLNENNLVKISLHTFKSRTKFVFIRLDIFHKIFKVPSLLFDKISIQIKKGNLNFFSIDYIARFGPFFFICVKGKRTKGKKKVN